MKPTLENIAFTLAYSAAIIVLCMDVFVWRPL